jgi:SAM-dependent MidA family methyltransferase
MLLSSAQADHASAGHPGTVGAILAEIRSSGQITFARFMEMALYHPEFGYYTRIADAEDEKPWPPRCPIGRSGDYDTSPEVSPLLARALARQIAQIDTLLGNPQPLTVVEMGPGSGRLAREFLLACEQQWPVLLPRLRYLLIERSRALSALQRKLLAPWVGTPVVSWFTGLTDLPDGAVIGTMFSNELVDAFPVHRIRVVDGTPCEIYVTEVNGRFVERTGPLSTPRLAEYLADLTADGVSFPEGYTTEINLEAIEWMKEVARVLARGVVITIDYGHTAKDRYAPYRNRGTLICYVRHQVSEDPYSRVGYQDMTAHVDFTALAATGEAVGLKTTGFTNQMSFLMSLGADEILATVAPESLDMRAACQLLRPDGMGRTLKILVQHKGMPMPVLDGLRFKPFFAHVLSRRQQAELAAHTSTGHRNP